MDKYAHEIYLCNKRIRHIQNISVVEKRSMSDNEADEIRYYSDRAARFSIYAKVMR